MTMWPCWGRLAVEGEWTGDERMFDKGSLRWEDLPLAFRWCPEDFGGHQGAYHTTWIDEIQRVGDEVMFRGRVFDQRFHDYLELAGQCGVSVDCDDETFQIIVPPEDVVPGPEGGTFEPAFEKQLFSDARIRGATAVDFGAFIEGVIFPGEPPTGDAAGSAAVASDSPGNQDVVVAAAGEAPATTAPSEGVVDDDQDDEVTDADVAAGTLSHSGILLAATDTGRWLMLQRALEGEDPNAGLWEFPGGGIEDGESPEDAARREFAEECGVPLPDDATSPGSVDSSDGVYRLFVFQIPTEAEYPIDDRNVSNPDDPDGDQIEALAWWDPGHLEAGGPHIRPEVQKTDWTAVEQLLGGDAATIDGAASGTTPSRAQFGDLVKQTFESAQARNATEGPSMADAPAGDQAPGEGTDQAPGDPAAAIELLNQALPLVDPDIQDQITELIDTIGASMGPVPTEEDNLVASAAPVAPPSEWFDEVAFDGPTPLTITADGRVFGHFTTWDSCHAGDRYKNTCQKPPSDPNPEFFHLGQVLTAEGTTVDVGRITVGGGHADVRLGLVAALEHYDNAATCVAVVHAYEDKYGPAVVGSVVPEATPTQIAQLRRSPVSGDWRVMPGTSRRRATKARKLIGIHAVNVPGYPMPRAGQSLGLVASISPEAFVTYGRVEACGECGDDEPGLVAAVELAKYIEAEFDAEIDSQSRLLEQEMADEITTEITTTERS